MEIPGGLWAFVPPPLPPSLVWTPALVSALAEAQRALGVLAGVGRQLQNPHLLVKPLQRREAVASSRIENTFATVRQLFLFEAEPTTAPEGSDVREVDNYVRALEHGLKRQQELPLCLRLIRELHAELM
ncbi:MAG: Fic family protein, partial [Actinobacteria bacterium]|nr:Fic family protein [Actinomycetota bacterium]